MNMDMLKTYEKLASQIAKKTVHEGYNPTGIQGLEYAVRQYSGPDEPIVHAMIGACLVLMSIMEAKEVLSQFGTSSVLGGLLG